MSSNESTIESLTAERDRLARRVAELEGEVGRLTNVANGYAVDYDKAHERIADLRAKLEESHGTNAITNAKLAAAGGGVDKEILETSRQMLAACIVEGSGTAVDIDVESAIMYARALHAALWQAGGVE